MKILVTGAGGYLGQGLVVPFEGNADLRLMDVNDFDTLHEKVIGNVADLDSVQRAVQGVDASSSHTWRRARPVPTRHLWRHTTPTSNGTANLLFAAVAEGPSPGCR